MKKQNHGFTIRPSVAAVRAALLAMAVGASAPAWSADIDPDLAALVQRPSTVDVGAIYVNKDSAKFGEYNGLDKKGWYGLLNFDVSSIYDPDDPARWRLIGRDIGLDTRSIAARYSDQGKFSFDLGYDSIIHNRSDTYQSPYQGLGSSNLTLPSNWLAPRVPQVSATSINFRSLSPVTGLAPARVSGVLTPPTAAQQAQVNNIIANDVPAFQEYDINTKRQRYNGGFSYDINSRWDVKGSVIHEDKKGSKPMGTVSSQVSEFSATIPDPIDQSTDQYNLSLNYKGDKGFFQAAYYGSIFRNSIQSITWQDVNDLSKFATMGSAPDNQYHQALLTGGYRFSQVTKLVVKGSYARATQDEGFISSAQNNQLPLGLPTSSLHGLVVSRIFDAKLTSRPAKDLNLMASYKYDDRDNRTPINTYFFQDANESASGTSPFSVPLGLKQGTLGSNINIYNNRPYSKTTNQADLEGNYKFAPNQWIDAAYQFQKLDRSCPGSWIDCEDADTTKENTGRIEWKGRFDDTVTARVSYAYSQRRVDNYNENAFLALVPMANVLGVGGAATNGSTVATQTALQYMIANGLTGYGPLAGYSPPYTGNALIYGNNGGIIPQALYGSRNNINELPGMRRFNMADRNRDKVRSMLNWDATEKFSLQAAADYNKDDYSNSVYGLTGAKSWNATIEGTFNASDTLSASFFYTYEDIRSQSAGDAYGANSSTASVNGFTAIDPVACYGTIAARNLNGKQDPCLNWSTDMRDKIDTAGFSVRKTGLAGGRLWIAGDLLYTRATTDVGVNGGSYANNPLAVAGAPAGTIAAFYIPAAALPQVKTERTTFRLTGQYSLNKQSLIGAYYVYERMNSIDYAYQGMQFGTGTNYMPTLEQAPNYNVSVVAVWYTYRFR